jgi:DNA-binding NarL/FixJ family response regulator
MPNPKILLADDHTIVLEGLTRLLEPEFEVVAKAGDGRSLIDLAVKLNPDVIIADISMPILSGMEAVRQLKRRGCRAKIIFLSMHSDVELGQEALRVGASAYILKSSAAETLTKAIREALCGRIYVSPRLSIGLLSAVPRPARQPRFSAHELTQREREVLQLVAEGRTIRGIANILDIACRTVVFHKSNLMDKLGLRTTAELTCHAIQCGFLAAPRHGNDYSMVKRPVAIRA